MNVQDLCLKIINSTIRLGVLGLFLLISALHCSASSSFKTKVAIPKVILDADIDSDVDDAGALAMLLNLHKKGVIELLGVITTSDDPYAASCVSAINTFYGCPDIPVGFLMGQSSLSNHSRYTKSIVKEFPAKIAIWSEAEESTILYRRLLAQSPDGSVTIITIGHLSSLQKLLQSSSDQLSPLNGKQLAANKTSGWICMGGQFPSGKEANFYRPDPASTVYCLENWKKEVLFCGWEAGKAVMTGGLNLKNRLNPGHPVYRAYELYNQFAGRSSWDQLAVLQLTDKGRRFFSCSETGRCEVAEDGSNSWRNDSLGIHRYLIVKQPEKLHEIEAYIEDLIIGL